MSSDRIVLRSLGLFHPDQRLKTHYPQDPISVLAHHGEPVENDRLPGSEGRDRALGIQLLGQVEVDIPHWGHDILIS